MESEEDEREVDDWEDGTKGSYSDIKSGELPSHVDHARRGKPPKPEACFPATTFIFLNTRFYSAPKLTPIIWRNCAQTPVSTQRPPSRLIA
jgi:hypothetical protein